MCKKNPLNFKFNRPTITLFVILLSLQCSTNLDYRVNFGGFELKQSFSMSLNKEKGE